ncbi:ufm1-specific protease 2-like [Apostichopus japonicus]|uniref:ufm1-specific protease 2-like n=1 Tax=Stichopus japonicus TaxID=307972 RepID=UPI003AB8AE46
MAAPYEIEVLDSCVEIFEKIKRLVETDNQTHHAVLISCGNTSSTENSVILDAVVLPRTIEGLSSVEEIWSHVQEGSTVHSILCVSPSTVTADFAKESVKNLSKNFHDEVDAFYFWDVSSGGSAPSRDNFSLYESSSELLQPCDIGVLSIEEHLNKLIYLRINGNLSVNFTYASKDDFHQACENSFSILKERLKSSQVVYHLKETRLIFGFNDRGGTVTGASIRTVEDVLELTQVEEDEVRTKKKKGSKKRVQKEKVVDVTLLFKTGQHTKEVTSQYIVPTVQYETFDEKVQNVSIHLTLNTVVPQPSTSKATLIPECLRNAALKQVSAMERCLQDNFMKHGVRSLTPYLFKVPSHSHLISVVYPDGVSEDELEFVRKDLHTRYLLPTDRPYFRRLNKFVFPQDRREPYLTNTHEGLPPSGVSDGEVSLVQGTYSYHHYMQDQLNDNHWGCAYRSLQTLCSWFRHQGYTDKPVPTHKEIQQILVDVKDKPANFVGTKQWIGSIEVSTVLNQLLDITSKILFISTGADLVSKGRELAHHFKTQGTPIMSGGGARAHTILGVDFSSKTGDIKFLVLDPHYTGDEDIKVIQDKGWCAWQGPDFWDQTAYYNLCLPQRPVLV